MAESSRKIIVGIFAHPDDEAFGPGGTLATFAQNNDVYIICATSGESATGTTDENLGRERQEELRKSCAILGIKDIFFLEYVDGTLSNNVYHEIGEKVQKILEKLQPDVLITFEPRGVSGHLDHIAMSMIAQFVFPKIPSAKKLMMYCNTYERSLLMHNNYFIYYPYGYKDDEIDEVVDIADVWETKVKAMYEHKSQIHDIERILSHANNFPKKEYFLVEEK